MRLGLRRAPEPAGPRAVYARILDGETLWLAVTGATTVRLGEGELDLSPDGDLLTARVPLSGPGALTADGVPLPAAEGALEHGPLTSPTTRDGRWQYAVEDPVALRVTRTAREPEPTLTGARVEDDALVLDLSTTSGPLLLLDGETVVAEVPLTGGTARLTAELVPDRPHLTLAVGDDPVRRDRNALRFPGAAVVLPGLGPELAPYLRWLRDGRLALARAEESDT